MYYRLLVDSNSNNTIFINNADMNFINLNLTNETTLYAGSRNVKCKVIYEKNINKKYLKISKDIFDFLSIPSNLNYQIIVSKDGIRIGPVIGLLLNSDFSSLINNKITSIKEYSVLYPIFKGLFYVFSSDEININKNLIRGYYLNLDETTGISSWEEGHFPYPNVVYRRIGLSEDKLKHLKKNTSNNIFNSYYFNKLQFWNMIKNNDDLINYVPKTKVLSSFEVLDQMLSDFSSVYLKLADGSMGLGLMKFIKKGNNYYVHDLLASSPTLFNSKDEAVIFINKLIKKNLYLIQQPINSLKIDNRCTHLRVIMQKDNSLNWQCTGIISCIGKDNGISSNYVAFGYNLTFEKMFQKIGMKKSELFEIRQEIIRTCYKFCEALDATNEHYGDLGIDVIVDDNFKVWIIEINKRHDHAVPLKIHDNQMYLAVKNNPVKYAVALSNFKLEI